VAGKGVRLTADTENNRWIVEADETVLYQNDNPSQILADTNLTLSESYMNFEKIKLELLASAGSSANATYYVESPVLQNAITELSTLPVCSTSTQMHDLNSFVFQTTATTTCTVKSSGTRLNVGGAGITTTASRGVRVFKIVGVNRIASN
jgi:hypothetical protein